MVEGILKIVPYLAGYFFIIIVIALVMNLIDAWRHPESRKRSFDPVKNFSKINSAGMIKVLSKKSQDRSSQASF